jgi:hypothetical protein
LHTPAHRQRGRSRPPIEERRRLQQEAIDEMDDEWEKELNERNKAKAGIDEEQP